MKYTFQPMYVANKLKSSLDQQSTCSPVLKISKEEVIKSVFIGSYCLSYRSKHTLSILSCTCTSFKHSYISSIGSVSADSFLFNNEGKNYTLPRSSLNSDNNVRQKFSSPLDLTFVASSSQLRNNAVKADSCQWCSIFKENLKEKYLLLKKMLLLKQLLAEEHCKDVLF